MYWTRCCCLRVDACVPTGRMKAADTRHGNVLGVTGGCGSDSPGRSARCRWQLSSRGCQCSRGVSGASCPLWLGKRPGIRSPSRRCRGKWLSCRRPSPSCWTRGPVHQRTHVRWSRATITGKGTANMGHEEIMYGLYSLKTSFDVFSLFWKPIAVTDHI